MSKLNIKVHETKKNESFTLPRDVADAMKLVKDFLEKNQDAIVDEQIVSDVDAAVGYQIELALNVLTDLVANAPKSESKKNEDHPDEYYKWADEKVAEEYADDYGLFSTVVDDMMSLADDMANDIISEHGLEDSEKLHEDIKELVYESMCRTMVSQFGGVTKDR